MQGKHIVAGVCGSIAIFKAVEVVSQLQQRGALVDVILTKEAQKFILPLTFSTMSHRPAYTDLWESSGEAAENHIKLAEQADLLLVLPATANSIAKLAHGLADDMLSTVVLASRAPLLLAPAMHHQMLDHPATRRNLEVLQERGATIIPPEYGRLASGAIGQGRLAELEDILGAIAQVLGRQGDLAGQHVLVTAGGTHEPIDPVRFIGNRSSGMMGYALAEAARNRGAQVTLISGPVAIRTPFGIKVVRVETAREMCAAVLEALPQAAALVMAAAVADFRPEQAATDKIKKESRNAEFSLNLVRNPDILLETLAQRQGANAAFPGLIRVGFAAETSDIEKHAVEKLNRKQLDLLVANDVSRSDSGFGAITNKVTIYTRTNEVYDLPTLEKTEVANIIWDHVKELW